MADDPDMPELAVVAEGDYPAFVGGDEADRFRWRVCLGIARQMADEPSWAMIAGAMFRSDIATDGGEQPEMEPDVGGS